MTLEDTEKEVISFHRETFPNATIKAIAEKFDEEFDEFYSECLDTLDVFADSAMVEFADMCIVYMAGLDRIGKTTLSALIQAKLEINKSRVWGKETENGDKPRDKP